MKSCFLFVLVLSLLSPSSSPSQDLESEMCVITGKGVVGYNQGPPYVPLPVGAQADISVRFSMKVKANTSVGHWRSDSTQTTLRVGSAVNLRSAASQSQTSLMISSGPSRCGGSPSVPCDILFFIDWAPESGGFSSGNMTLLFSAPAGTLKSRSLLEALNLPREKWGSISWGTHWGQHYGGGPITDLTMTPPCQRQPVLLDPVPSMLTGARVTRRPDRVDQKAPIVEGVSADGAAQVVVRVPATFEGERISVNVLSDCGNPDDPKTCTLSSDVAANGGVALPGSEAFRDNQPATAVNVRDIGPMAYVTYRAPADFVSRSAHTSASERFVVLEMAGETEFKQYKKVRIVRPPVVLVHGLWATAGDWSTFTGLTSDQRFFMRLADYGLPVGTSITGATPSYDREVLDKALGSSVGFGYGANVLFRQIQHVLKEFRGSAGASVAAVRVDVIGHSMGGVVARAVERLPAYYHDHNFRNGWIHKLITIGTPHLGSPLANALLNDANKCVRDVFADNDLHSFSSTSGVAFTDSGGVGDLRGDGNGSGLSGALATLRQPGARPLPGAMIVGQMSSTQLAGLDCIRCKMWALKNLLCPSNPITNLMNSSSFPGLMGGASDGIVPAASARNGRSTLRIAPLTAIHSPGTVKLGFLGPTLLDAGFIGPVITLLNTPVTDTSAFAPVAQ